jgi:hypothetical protein
METILANENKRIKKIKINKEKHRRWVAKKKNSMV